LRIPPDKVLLRPGKFGKMSTTSTLMLPPPCWNTIEN